MIDFYATGPIILPSDEHGGSFDAIALYVIVDLEDRPVYVGISRDPWVRWIQHRSRFASQDGNRMVVLHWFRSPAATRFDAAKCEKWAIFFLRAAGYELENGTPEQPRSVLREAHRRAIWARSPEAQRVQEYCLGVINSRRAS